MLSKKKKKKTRINTNRNKLFIFESQKALLLQINESCDTINSIHKQIWKNQLRQLKIFNNS